MPDSEISAANFFGALGLCAGLAAVVATPFAILIWADNVFYEKLLHKNDRYYKFLETKARIDRQRLNESGLQKMDYPELEAIAAAAANEIKRRKAEAEAALWHVTEMDYIRDN